MSRFKRSNFLLFTIESLVPATQTDQAPRSEIVATSLLSGHFTQVTPQEVNRLQSWPEDSWQSVESLMENGWAPRRLLELASHGVLIAEEGAGDLAEWGRLEAELGQQIWPPFGLIFHAMNQHAENYFGETTPDDNILEAQRTAHVDAERFIATRGLPPPAFYHPAESAGPTIDLPRFETQPVDFFEVARRRRSTRSFDLHRALSLVQVSQLLYWSFGCLATRQLGSSFVSLFKVAASGGALHPLEAYVLALRVDGLQPGFYHYDVKHHRLRPHHLFENLAAAQAFAGRSAQKQLFVADAPLLAYVVARFQRNFWKYRQRNNTYAVILKDLGHLSQVFQLCATALGLGAFYTGAIYPKLIAQTLKLPVPAEAPLGILGVGYSDEDPMQEGIVAYDPFAMREVSD